MSLGLRCSDAPFSLSPVEPTCYQPEWDENLARAYEKSFSEEELASLVADGPASQYVEKVNAQQATVGGEMRSTSEPIVVALVTEALKATMEKRVP